MVTSQASIETNPLYGHMMTSQADPNMLLEHVNCRMLMKDRNPSNLLELLRIVAPNLTLKHIESETIRMAAIKDLLVMIHPKKFPKHPDALSIYEDVQEFYDHCNRIMNGFTSHDEDLLRTKKTFFGKKTSSPTAVVSSVVQFNVRQKWSFLDGYVRPLSPDDLTSGKILSPLVAYHCINARGAITHGKRPSLIYSWENVKSCIGMSVMEVFNKHGGFKTIKGTDEIKVEIIENGPVVSFTFTPSSDFAEKYGSSIIKTRIDKHHYCLIIGWKLTEFGEVWLVRTYDGSAILEVPFGTYSIDDKILAPKDDFINVTWQQGPYFDRDLSKFPNWHSHKSISIMLKPEELQDFCESLIEGKGIHEAVTKKIRIVIRDKNKLAHSRSCHLEDLLWEKELKMWRLKCTFNDTSTRPKICMT